MTIQIEVLSKLNTGDAGRMITMHAEIYKSEENYGSVFEGYVCKTLYEVLVYPSKNDKYFIAKDRDQIVGTIAIIDKDEGLCQLRWLLVDPDYRGNGLGQNLVNQAMEYASKHFNKIFLESTHTQTKAVKLYKKLGFVEVSQYEIKDWGVPLTGIVMEKTFK